MSPDESEKSERSEAIGSVIKSSVEDDGTDSEQTESPTEEQTESLNQSQTQSQTQSVMESLGVEPEEQELKKSKKHVNMYLDEDLADALDERYEELNTLHEKQQGYGIEKSRHFYPALIEAAFRDDASIVDVLGISI